MSAIDRINLTDLQHEERGFHLVRWLFLVLIDCVSSSLVKSADNVYCIIRMKQGVAVDVRVDSYLPQRSPFPHSEVE